MPQSCLGKLPSQVFILKNFKHIEQLQELTDIMQDRTSSTVLVDC